MFFNVFQGLQPEAKIKKKEKNDDRNIFSNILNFWGEKQSSPLTPRVEQVLTSFKRRFIEVLLFLQQPKNDQEKLKCLRQVYELFNWYLNKNKIIFKRLTLLWTEEM